MEQTRANAIRILNDAKLCADANEKVTLLSQLTELVVRTAPALAREFTQELVVLQLDQSPTVRKWLCTFLGEACASYPEPGVLALAAGALQSLVQDGAPGVAKQGLLSCVHLLRGSLAQLSLQPANTELQALMEAAKCVSANAAAAGQRHSSEAVRLSAAKLREIMVLLFTADSAPALPGAPPDSARRLPNAAALAQEADTQLRALLDTLRQQAASGSGGGPANGAGAKPSGPLLITLIKALSAIGVQRPGLLGRVLPSLMNLAKEGGYRSTGCEEAVPMKGGEVSVGNALRLALAAILKSRADTSVPWRERIVESLGCLGAADTADSCMKYIQRQDYKEQKAARQREPPAAAGAADPAAKRQRTQGPPSQAPTPPAAASTPPPSGTLTPTGNGTAGAGAGPAAVDASMPPVTSDADLEQLLKLLITILGSGDRAMLDAFVNGVPASALADVVLTNLAHLPSHPPPTLSYTNMAGPAAGARGPREVSPSPPPQGWGPGQGAQGSWQQGGDAGAQAPQATHQLHAPVASLPGVGPVAGAWGVQQQQQQQHLGYGSTPPLPPGAGRAERSPTPELLQQQVQQPGRGGATAGGAAPAAETVYRLPLPQLSQLSRGVPRHLRPGEAARPADLPPSVPPASGTSGAHGGDGFGAGAASHTGGPVEALVLPTEQQLRMRDAAVTRILGCGHMPRLQDFRELVASRLAACHPTHYGEVMLSAIVEEWGAGTAGSGRGCNLALRWLDALFVECVAAAKGKKGLGLEGSAVRASGAGAGEEAGPGPGSEGKGKAGWLMEELEAGDGESGEAKKVDSKEDLLLEEGREGLKGEAKTEGQEETGRNAVEAGAQGPGGDGSVGGADVDTGLSGTVYEDVLLALLERLREAGLFTETRELLLQAPALPLPGTIGFLRQQVDTGGETARSVLSAARALIQERPPVRPEVLQLVLQAAIHLDSSTRDLAVRLVCNQLIQDAELAAVVLPFARESIDQLGQQYMPGTQQQPGQGSREAVAGVAGVASSGDAGQGQGEASGATPEVAAEGAEGMDGVEGPGAPQRPATAQQPAATAGPGAEPAPAAAAAAGSEAAAATASGTATEAGAGPGPGAAEAGTVPGAGPPVGQEWTPAEAVRRCDLYTALCMKQPLLLGGLLDAYAAAAAAPAPAAAQALLSAVSRAAKTLGPACGPLVSLVSDHPPGAEPAVLAMLEAAAEAAVPSAALVIAARQWAAESGDVRPVAPLVLALPKQEVLGLLPQLLQMPGTNLKALYRKLVTPMVEGGTPMFSPAELLVALHCPEPGPGGALALPQKAQMAAVDTALHSPDVFPQHAIAQAIEAMEGRAPLPALFMRSVIVAVKGAPKLRPFVGELLSRLISKQIWVNKAQWRGFLVLVENSDRTFFPNMLQLPPPVLEQALLPTLASEPHLQWAAAVKLAVWATAPDCTVQMALAVRRLLEAVLERQQREQAAAAAAAAAQKAEEAAQAAQAAAEAKAAAAAAAAAAAEAAAAVDAAPLAGEEGPAAGLAVPSAAGADAGAGGGAGAPARQLSGGQAEDEFTLQFDEDE